jgi:hypothetical protein
MSTQTRQVFTVGDIARYHSVARHQVDYILRTLPHIQPFEVAGAVRCFDRQAVDQIGRELSAIDARRAGGAR